MKRRKGFYSISVVAKMFSVHQQTVRMYEKQGLITPKRSEGNTRLFSEEDVDRLEEVIYLTHKLGVNLAGVEIILKLQKKVKRMQDDMNKMFKDAEGEFVMETEQIRQDIKKQAQRLVEIKQENKTKAHEHMIEITPQDKKSGRTHASESSIKLISVDEEPEEMDAVEDIEIDYDKD